MSPIFNLQEYRLENGWWDLSITKLVESQGDQSINQLSKCLISISTDSKAHHPVRKA